MLLLAVMASTASARSIAFPEPQYCCNAIEAKCEACKAGMGVEEMCRVHEEDMALDSHLQPLQGCPKKPKKCCRANTLECQACNAGVSRTNSAEGILTHMSALGSLPSHLILITAIPRSGTPKSCMVRWVQGSAAGTETGRASPSARRTH